MPFKAVFLWKAWKSVTFRLDEHPESKTAMAKDAIRFGIGERPRRLSIPRQLAWESHLIFEDIVSSLGKDTSKRDAKVTLVISPCNFSLLETVLFPMVLPAFAPI
jgi:hypothetical protein